MTTYTMTGSGSLRDIGNASIFGVTTARTGGDIFNLNGFSLTIDQDTRYGLSGASTFSLGSITLSATLGGTLNIDARYVRMVPFTGGSGTITAGTLITCGSATAKVIGLYSAINTAPVLTGVATGWIKVTEWNGVPFPTSGAFTQAGYTFIISGADTAGFIEVVGDEASTITAVRLGAVNMLGDWYQVGTTAGARTDTYQLPTNGSAIDIAGVWVETAASSGVYEFWPCAGTVTATATTMAPNDFRGKVCWIARTTGILRFGHDGTNSAGGLLPGAGRRIRIPNIITANCTTAARGTNAAPNGTLGTRYDFTTTGGGVLNFDKVNLAWYPSIAQAYSLSMSNVATCDQLNISEMATAVTLNECHVAPAPTSAVQQALSIALLPAGITINNSKFVRLTVAAVGNYVATATDGNYLRANNTHSFSLTYQGNAGTGSWSFTRFNDVEFAAGCITQRTLFTSCNIVNVISPLVYDHPATNTPSTTGRTGVDFVACNDYKVNGWDNGGLLLCQPYNSLIGISNSQRGTVENIGTYASPITLGGNESVASYTRSTTTATVTMNNHGMITGGQINVYVSNDVTAITLGVKTVTVTGVNTFTFTCLNAGAVSGSISYIPVNTSTVVTMPAGSANNDVKIRRVYYKAPRGSLSLGDNSNTKVKVETYLDRSATASGAITALNSDTKGLMWQGNTTGQASVYGTHFVDYYTLLGTTNFQETSVAWTRSSTVATVTLSSHLLRTINGRINVVTSSSEAAITLGVKTITVTGENTFTFACLNAGATSGTLTLQRTNGVIQLLMNEPTSLTTSQVTTTGNAKFTSAGTLSMPTIGDTVEFTSNYFIKGHSRFLIDEPTMSGATNTNFMAFYQIDTGSGFSGTWKNLANTQNTNAGTGVTTLTVTNSALISVNDYVFGTSIAPNSRVTQILNATQVQIDKATIGSVTNQLLRYCQLPNEVITDPNTGFRLKIKLQTRATNTQGISAFFVWSWTSNTSMEFQYPLPGIQLSITGLVTGSDVVILQAGTSNILASVDSNATSTYVYDYTTIENVDIGIIKPGYVPLYIRNYALTSSNASLPVAQQVDRNYA